MAEERFKEISEAYEVLMDTDEAQAVRQVRPRRRQQPVPGRRLQLERLHPSGRHTRHLRGRRLRRRQHIRHVLRRRALRGPHQGQSLRYDLEITLEEAASGRQEGDHPAAHGQMRRLRRHRLQEPQGRALPSMRRQGSGAARGAPGLLAVRHGRRLPQMRRHRQGHQGPVPRVRRRLDAQAAEDRVGHPEGSGHRNAAASGRRR